MKRAALRVIGLRERMLDGGHCHIGVRRVGRAGFRMPWHGHRGYVEIVLGLKGTFGHRIRRTRHAQGAGTWTWVGEAEAHELSGVSCAWANIAIALPLWRRMAALAGPGALPPAGRMRRGTTAQGEAWAARIGPWAGRGGDAAAQRAVMALFFDLMAGESADAAGDGGPRHAPEWWVELVRELESGTEAPPRVEELPARCGKSAAHLARTFRQFLGCTPSAHLNRLRLERAARWLETGGLPVAEIAYRCGFESLGYFYTLFRGRYGRSPRGHRAQARAMG